VDKLSGVRPEHKVCKVNVAVPTISVQTLFDENGPEVLVQWYGESNTAELEEMQFLFLVPVSPDKPNWVGHPEKFNVVFLGKVKDWPQKEAAQGVADGVTEGDLESFIIWVTSVDPSHCSVYSPSVGAESPVTFVLHMCVVLGDRSCGVITPRSYSDITVLERANATYEADNERRSQETAQDMEEDPEVPGWEQW